MNHPGGDAHGRARGIRSGGTSSPHAPSGILLSQDINRHGLLYKLIQTSAFARHRRFNRCGKSAISDQQTASTSGMAPRPGVIEIGQHLLG